MTVAAAQKRMYESSQKQQYNLVKSQDHCISLLNKKVILLNITNILNKILNIKTDHLCNNKCWPKEGAL